MRKLILSTFAMALSLATLAQVREPVKWAFSSKKTGNDAYEVHLSASIEKGWHLYSQNTPSGGPIPTEISFTKSPLVTMQGKAKESGKMEKHNEPLFGVDVLQYSEKVDFVQPVKLKASVKTTVSGSVEFMVCNDKECLPPKKVPFSVALQ